MHFRLNCFAKLKTILIFANDRCNIFNLNTIDMKIEEVKAVLDEKFDMNNERLEEKFEHLHYKLDIIKEQTMKTNGRVTKLEDRAEVDRQIHINCPVKKELDEFKAQTNDDLVLIKFAKNYPKLATLLGGVLIMLIISGGMEGLMKLLGLS